MIWRIRLRFALSWFFRSVRLAPAELFAVTLPALETGLLEEEIQRETEFRALLLADEHDRRSVRQLKMLRSSYPPAPKGAA